MEGELFNLIIDGRKLKLTDDKITQLSIILSQPRKIIVKKLIGKVVRIRSFSDKPKADELLQQVLDFDFDAKLILAPKFQIDKGLIETNNCAMKKKKHSDAYGKTQDNTTDTECADIPQRPTIQESKKRERKACNCDHYNQENHHRWNSIFTLIIILLISNVGLSIYTIDLKKAENKRDLDMQLTLQAMLVNNDYSIELEQISSDIESLKSSVGSPFFNTNLSDKLDSIKLEIYSLKTSVGGPSVFNASLYNDSLFDELNSIKLEIRSLELRLR